ncbi:MAG: double-strand break repair protein AddB [Caulobacteraceae bacterium]
MELFGSPGARWFTITPGRPFLKDLAAGLLDELGTEGLPEAGVLLPTRRAARALAAAFLDAAPGRALLLPRIQTLGDLDAAEPPFAPGDLDLELPPAIGGLRRRFELAGLIAEAEPLLGRTLNAGDTLDLADALARLLDACQIEEIDEAVSIAEAVDADMAGHWRLSSDFLEHVLAAWPKRLAEVGLMDPAKRRVALTRALAKRWREAPPSAPIVAAGSTGAAPAAADLLTVIAALPLGCVVLPGLDASLDESAWRQVDEDEQHPQAGLKRLLRRAGLDRGDTVEFAPSTAQGKGGARRRLLAEALRPAEATDDWLASIDRLRAENPAADPIAEGFEGLSVVSARDEEEAARLAALAMREALETPRRTCALITPDAALARRVGAALGRWGLRVDSSAGEPLALTPVGTLVGLTASWICDPTSPARILAILKHPLTRLGRAPADLERRRSRLEKAALRGVRAPTWPDLERKLEGDAASRELLDRLASVLAFAEAPHQAGPVAAGAAARGLAEALEALAEGPFGGSGDLWAGPDGEAAAGLLAGLIEESAALPPVTRAGFAELVESLLASQTAAAREGGSPRLKILGVLEARLIDADLFVLAGLEEGVWPRAAGIDPFLSRPMRQKLGLPPPERRIGLQAHDFAQAVCAPDVILLHCERRDGAPAVASRWLWRLRTLAQGARVELPGRPDLEAWAHRLDAPIFPPPRELAPALCPKPTPPLDLRPRRASVTQIERWIRDPYAIYARHILELRPVERPDEPISARERGTAIHKAFERFARAHDGPLPNDAEALFAALIEEELLVVGTPTERMAWERARAAKIAAFAIQFEAARRGEVARILVEQAGSLELTTPLGPFTLTARADRLEARGERVDILDFKTGSAPTRPQMEKGFSPQLTLTAAILAGGGFADLGPLEAGELCYVRVNGARQGGETLVRAAFPESGEMGLAALERLRRFLARYAEPATPFRSWAWPERQRYAGDYDHLARVWEWRVLGEAQGDAT